jgi:hypothetical protein
VSAAPPEARSIGLTARQPVVLLLASGIAIALTETRLPSIIGVLAPPMDASRLILGVAIFVIALNAADHSWRLPWRQLRFAILLAFVGCLVAGFLGGVAWPNSGDEYSYVFLADTFRAGRLWDKPPPDPLLFRAFHVLVMDGRTFSPYAPGWSILLAPFRALGIGWLANPLLTVALATALAGALARLGVSQAVQKPALALVLLTPFTLFLGGSLFPQTMAGALVVGIVWSQLVDEARPHPARKLLTGALFGVLLLTRYDVFAVVVLCYATDRLVRRRFAAILDGLLVVLGLLPFVVCLGFYNAGVSGNPFQLTPTWAAAETADPTVAPISLGLRLIIPVFLSLHWLGNLAQFGGLPVLVLAAVALAAKLRSHSCRFYDFLLPAAVLFYAFAPFTGGHQYGPRYWFWAWPLAMLTVTTGLVEDVGFFQLRGRRVSFEAFSAACVLAAAAAFCVLLVTTHSYIAARRAVFLATPAASRSVVLLPDRSIEKYWWPAPGIPASNLDFTRNDVDYDGAVLYARGDVPDAVPRACALPGRKVFRWQAPDRLVPVICP